MNHQISQQRLLYQFALLLLVSLCFPVAVLSQAADQQEESAAEAVPAQEEKTPSVPAIYLAAKTGDVEQVRYLIASGEDINAANPSGRTPLMSAVYNRNKRIVRELLAEGADVNAADTQGRTALLMAVTNYDKGILMELLNAGADVKAKDNYKNTASSLAEKSENKELIKLLENY